MLFKLYSIKTYCGQWAGRSMENGRSRIDRVYADIKVDSNTRLNNIMISFIDHYNAISIDRPYSSKAFNYYFNKSLLCNPNFSSATKGLLPFLKTQQTINVENTLNLVLKRMLVHCLINSPFRKLSEFPC